MEDYTFKQTYELGFPDVKGPKKVYITFHSDEVEFEFSGLFSDKTITIPSEDIIYVKLGQESYHSVGKTVGGAVIGTVLSGGLGLIVGAALGGKRRKENRLCLVVNYMGVDCDIFLEPDKNTQKVYMAFKTFQAETKQIGK